MRVEVFENYAALSGRAAAIALDLIRRKPDAVLGLPTGSSPEGFYDLLSRSNTSFRHVRTFNLDEYVGLPREHPESYHSFMSKRLLDRVDLEPANVHIPDGMAADPEAECRRYEEALRQAGGMDLLVLGVGHNGHIGFNEPGTPWDSRTRRVKLAGRTIKANARFFGSEEAVPREALTMGIGTIMEARSIILLATGESKADIIRRTFEEEPGINVPSTVLRNHPDVTFLLDRAAAGRLGQLVS